MPTAKQIAASRANAQKSTGPRTQSGKAKSRYNALKHGIDATQQIIFSESAEDLAELAAEYHELHSPANADERFLVDTLVNNEWRLRRLRCVEADLWRAANNLFIDNNPEIGESAPGDAFEASGPAFERLQRIMNSCQRHYHQARKQLQIAQAERADALQDPQPEQFTTTSESSGPFYSNPISPACPPPNPPVSVPTDGSEAIVSQVPTPPQAMDATLKVMTP
jgi:hypothetical protein